ncbi:MULTISPECIES: CoA-binding protein [Virgibacillus]|uniref:Acetyl coenzyme A synthetase (ADP forming), alpha domain n=2 Tax=Virgibacillus TaxID=84406 RepID=A0A024QD68_9BACI|nr:MULTISPECIES: CoA-binding protein [Virgibacillus]EQB36197.1 CoA-binding protein [Virgibacillus sp. CM-4]MYL42068.1 CoA-binding protein [Virgibacillus massiliensis]GGJ45836.1 CoA-binding protein [Virgibacillus kapii]CDQ39896.1 acetyl coenzyme A synthetase (ADP forming), alpha domain [Virgibacillus massiliensis]
MVWENPSNETLKDILTNARTIAVVGLSNNPGRTSYQIAKIMQQQGYRIIPVNPTVEEVLGETSYASLTEVPDKIDIINVFRRPEFLPEIANEAAQTNCKVFWAQQGIINQEAFDFLKQRDFTVVMDLCIKVVHAVLVK